MVARIKKDNIEAIHHPYNEEHPEFKECVCGSDDIVLSLSPEWHIPSRVYCTYCGRVETTFNGDDDEEKIDILRKLWNAESKRREFIERYVR